MKDKKHPFLTSMQRNRMMSAIKILTGDTLADVEGAIETHARRGNIAPNDRDDFVEGMAKARETLRGILEQTRPFVVTPVTTRERDEE